MVDLHAHILFGADDGAADLATSVEMCKIAAKDGIEKMVATPHYIIGEHNEEHISGKLKVLNECLMEQCINLELLPGNEIFIDCHIEKSLDLGKCLSLNHSKYLLIELPMREVPKYTYEVFYELQLKGYIPILAHPERNDKLLKNPEIIYELVMNGCLMQVNAMSFMGMFGKASKKMAQKLLRHRLIHFIATDAHSAGRRRPVLSGAKRCVEALADRDRAEALFVSGPEAVIQNGIIEVEEPIPIKKRHIIGLGCEKENKHYYV